MSDNQTMRWFECDHLPIELREVAERFQGLAEVMDTHIKVGSAEKSAGLRKLLEAKDCFVRAKIFMDSQTP